MGKTYRSLHTMNGDHLGRLKRPLCSEFSPMIKGSLNARREEHRKKVELMFKDRNFMLNKMSRSQDVVYKTLLRVHKARKILEREQYKRHQEDLRAGFQEWREDDDANDTRDHPEKHVDAVIQSVGEGPKDVAGDEMDERASSIRLKRVDDDVVVDDAVGRTAPNDIPEVRHPVRKDSKDVNCRDVVDDDGDGSSNEHDGLNTTQDSNSTKHSPKILPKSRVLEVRKGSKAVPIVRERSVQDEKKSDGADKLKSLAEPFPSIREVVLPAADVQAHTDTRASSSESSSKAKTKNKTKQLPELKEMHFTSLKPPPPNAYLKSKQDTMEAISEESGGHSARTGHVGTTTTTTHQTSPRLQGSRQARQPAAPVVQPSMSSWPSVSSSSKRHSFKQSLSSSSGRILSQIEQNRRKAAEKHAMVRYQLDKEPVVQYVLDAKRNVVPDLIGFNRKIFQSPTLREKHQQQKMLKSEVDAHIKQKQRMEKFFEKIELENEEKANLRRRQLAKLAADKANHKDAEREAKRSVENMGMTLTQLMAAFNRPDLLPDDVHPDSMEAVEICKYVRKYQPLRMSRQERQDAKINKTSSWDHNLHTSH